LALLLTFLILSNVISAEFFNISPKLTTFREVKINYTRLFILRSLAMVFLISLGITHNYDNLIYYIVACQTFYTVVILVWRPYKRILDNVGTIILEIVTLYALTLPLVMRFASVEELDEIFLVFILQGMLLISLAMNFVRIVVDYGKVLINLLKRN
jgi:hypothetical protein